MTNAKDVHLAMPSRPYVCTGQEQRDLARQFGRDVRPELVRLSKWLADRPDKPRTATKMNRLIAECLAAGVLQVGSNGGGVDR